jgi:hypothetical protein
VGGDVKDIEIVESKIAGAPSLVADELWSGMYMVDAVAHGRVSPNGDLVPVLVDNTGRLLPTQDVVDRLERIERQLEAVIGMMVGAGMG